MNSGDYATLDGTASSDPDNDTITSYLWTQTEGSTVDLYNNTNPTANFFAPTVSSDTELKFSLTVKDDKGDSSSPAIVTITVKSSAAPLTPVIPTVPNNTPPTAIDQSASTTMDKPIDITLEGSDPDKNDNLNAKIITPPTHGTLSNINQDTGVVTYIPNSGFIGTDSFTFKVNDGKTDSSNIGTSNVTVYGTG